MDTAMRDMELLKERDEVAPQRRTGVLVLGALGLSLGVFGTGVLLGRGGESPAEMERDPLLDLDRAAALEAAENAPANDEAADEAMPEVARDSLMFPETLTNEETRPEVQAALAAANAEYTVLTRNQMPEAMEPPVDVMPAAEAMPSYAMPTTVAPPTGYALPAAVAVGPAREGLERTARQDPMVAAALPPEAAAVVASGHDGEYTLQVISYQSPEPAEEFARALRARGHHAFVMSANVPDRGVHYRVRIGPMDTMREAMAYRASFEDTEHMNTFVVKQRDEAP